MQKELKRSATDCKIFGVCGGIAQYLGIDSNLVRLVWVAISLFAGSGIFLYIIAAFLLPKEEPAEADLKDVIRPEEEAAEEAADAEYTAEASEEEPEEPDLKSVLHPEGDE